MDQDSGSRPAGADGTDAPPSVPDEDLPADLRPADDNPLAQPADDDVPDDILTQGVGHGDSGGTPEDASSGDADVVGDDDSSATSADGASSGAESG